MAFLHCKKILSARFAVTDNLMYAPIVPLSPPGQWDNADGCCDLVSKPAPPSLPLVCHLFAPVRRIGEGSVLCYPHGVLH